MSDRDHRKAPSAVQGSMDVYKTKGAGDVLPVPICRSNMSGGTPSAVVHGTYAAGIFKLLRILGLPGISKNQWCAPSAAGDNCRAIHGVTSDIGGKKS